MTVTKSIVNCKDNMARHLFQNDHDDKEDINHKYEDLEEGFRFDLKSGFPSFINPNMNGVLGLPLYI